MSLPTVVQVRCPSCGRQYAVQSHQAIDAKREPQLKTVLLQGRFNLAACPQCGAQAALNRPFLYHDGEKSLFLLYQPMDLRADNLRQQQMVGAVQTQFVNSLPPEERRGYMLQPKVYLTFQSVLDDILIADGITREEIEGMRARTTLLEQLAQSQTLEELKAKVEQNQDKLDYAFYQLLANYIEQAAGQGDRETAEALTNLRDDLLSITRPEGGEQLEVGRDELANLLIEERDPEKLRRLVAVGRPLLDYYFFQGLADRIEAAQNEGNEIEARRLSKVRETILQIMDELESAAKQALADAAGFIRELVGNPNVEERLGEQRERLDDAFFAVLNANINEAQRRNDEKTAKALAALGSLAVKILEESAPPEVKLLNRLLRAKPEERRAILESERALIGPALLAMLEQMSGSLGAQSQALGQEVEQVRGLVLEMQGASPEG